MLPIVLLVALGAEEPRHSSGSVAPQAPRSRPPRGAAVEIVNEDSQRFRPRVLRDAALAAGASAAVALGKPDIRRAIFRDGSVGNVIENFAHPVAQVRAGTRRDTDPFWINHVAHPASFAAEALYLKEQGYGDGAAFLFTQVHSVLWEFVVEGCAFEPSGKDLVADAAGAAAAIWVLHPLWRKVRAPHTPVQVSVFPTRDGARVSLDWKF